MAAHVCEMCAYSEPPVEEPVLVENWSDLFPESSPHQLSASSSYGPGVEGRLWNYEDPDYSNTLVSGADDGSQGISLPNSANSGDQFIPTHSLNTSSAARDVDCNGRDTITSSSGRPRCLSLQNLALHRLPPEVVKRFNPDVDNLLVADALGLACIHSESSTVMYTPTATQQLQTLPRPLTHHVQLMHLIVYTPGHYKLLVAGTDASTEERPSLSTEEYDSTRGAWECTGIPFPFSLSKQYQNGAYYKDKSTGHEFVYFLVEPENGTTGVLMYDFQKKQSVPKSFKPLAPDLLNMRSKTGVASPQLVTAHIEGCDGSVFVLSEQAWQGEKYLCIHQLEPKASAGDGMLLKEVRQPYKWDDGNVSMFSTEDHVEEYVTVKSVKKTKLVKYICLDIYRNGPEGLIFIEKIMRLKTKRPRARNWSDKEKRDFSDCMEQGRREGKAGKALYLFVSHRLKELGHNRDAKQCEDFSDTLAKLRKRKREPKGEPNDGAGSSNPPVPKSHLIQGINDIAELGKKGDETNELTLERMQQGVEMTKQQEEPKEMLERVQQKEQAEEIHIDATIIEEQVELHKEQRAWQVEQGAWHVKQALKLSDPKPVKLRWHLKEAELHKEEEERNRQQVKELKKQKKLCQYKEQVELHKEKVELHKEQGAWHVKQALELSDPKQVKIRLHLKQAELHKEEEERKRQQVKELKNTKT